ncbi:MAG: hypothetical protein WAT39_17965 [Planctomycetota bacterium]
MATACFVPEKAAPTVGFGGTFATKFVHRGMTLVDNPVIQPRLSVELPATGVDKIGVDVEGNIDLRNDTGGAWFPDGHAGRFTQLETVARVTKQLGDVSLTTGIQSYVVPNGLEFPNSERGGTNEVFLLASATVLDANPYVALHYDFDEVRGGYYRIGLSEGIPLGGAWTLDLDGSLGYVSEAQASWMYALGESGWADLRGEAIVKWQYDARTQLRAGVHASMIVDNTIDAWFSQGLANPVDDDPIWFTLAVLWVF